MALLGADPGGEYYFSRTLAQALAEGIVDDSQQISFVSTAAAGRATTYAFSSGGGSGVWWGKNLGGNYQDVLVGWANYNSSSLFVNNVVFFTFTDVGTHQVELCTDGTGHLFFRRNGTNIGGTSTNALTTGWHYFEVRAHIASGTSGSCEVRVDGTVWLTVTGVNTQATANAYSNRFYIAPTVQNQPQYYKDIIWKNDTTYLGDRTVNVLYASAAGPSQQMSASSGTQVSCVQDGIAHTGTWPDDTNYILDSVSGHISDFQFQSITLPGGGTIDGVVHVSRLSKEVGSVVTMQQYTKSGGTTHTSASVTLGTSPIYFFDVLATDPNTSAAWTQTNLNNSTHGAKIV